MLQRKIQLINEINYILTKYNNTRFTPNIFIFFYSNKFEYIAEITTNKIFLKCFLFPQKQPTEIQITINLPLTELFYIKILLINLISINDKK